MESRPYVVVSAKVPPAVAEDLKRQARDEGQSPSARIAALIQRANDIAERGRALTEPAPITRATAASRAAYLMEQLSTLVSQTEKADPEGATLLVGGLSSACWAWQVDRLNRTELLDEALKRLHGVIDSAPGTERGSLMAAAYGNVHAAAKKLLGDTK